LDKAFQFDYVTIKYLNFMKKLLSFPILLFLVLQLQGQPLPPCYVYINSVDYEIHLGSLEFSADASFCVDDYNIANCTLNNSTVKGLEAGTIINLPTSPNSTISGSLFLFAMSKNGYTTNAFQTNVSNQNYAPHLGSFGVSVDVGCYDIWGDFVVDSYYLDTDGELYVEGPYLEFHTPIVGCPSCGGGGGGSSVGKGKNLKNSMVYPNPAKNRINLQLSPAFEYAQNVTVKVFELNGREVKSVQFPDTNLGILSMDIADLNAGNYILQATSSENTETVKLSVVNR
jgi:Secretion system C-terminal sorting domain